MERIGRLAGQINRHKNQQAGFVAGQPVRSHHRTPAERSHSCSTRVDALQDAGYSNGWRRAGFPHRGGHRGARMPAYRNRTLVLNGANQPGDADSGPTSDASASSWVSKTDRHMQLINTSIYKKDAQARTAAMEQTRRQKIALRDKQERAKLIHHLSRLGNSGGLESTNQQTPVDKYEIAVQGVRFIVAKNGSKLFKVPGASESYTGPLHGTHTGQVMATRPRRRPRRPLSEASSSIEARMATCTATG